MEPLLQAECQEIARIVLSRRGKRAKALAAVFADLLRPWADGYEWDDASMTKFMERVHALPKADEEAVGGVIKRILEEVRIR